MNPMSEKDPSDNRTAAMKWAHGAMWFLIWMGFGGCCFFNNRDAKTPLIQVTIQQK